MEYNYILRSHFCIRENTKNTQYAKYDEIYQLIITFMIHCIHEANLKWF